MNIIQKLVNKYNYYYKEQYWIIKWYNKDAGIKHTCETETMCPDTQEGMDQFINLMNSIGNCHYWYEKCE